MRSRMSWAIGTGRIGECSPRTSSVGAVMDFVFTDHAKQYGWGKISPERLATTWQAIAESQDLDPKWDPNQAFDTSLIPDK